MSKTEFFMRFQALFCRNVTLINVKINKKKFEEKSEGSCDIHAFIPEDMEEESKEKIIQNLEEATTLIRDHLRRKYDR